MDPVKITGTLADGAFKICKEVYDRIQGVTENDETCQRIEKQVKNLEKVAKELSEMERNELPETCNDFIAIFKDSLESCEKYCSDLKKTGTAKKLVYVYGHKKELVALEAELKKACDNLQLILQQVLLFQGRRTEEAVRRGTDKTIRTILNPNEGVYLPNCNVVGPRPYQVEKPEVDLDDSGDLMVVKWVDNTNPKEEITVNGYEICYNDENTELVSITPELGRLPESSNTFQVKLGPPRIELGNVYTVKVRGKNGSGAGKWSNSVIFRFKTGPPNKPIKPTVTVMSPTEIQIAIKLVKREENGSDITKCKVEYAEGIDGDSTSWTSLECSIKKRSEPDVKLKIESLKPDTTYKFRVRMINSAGESDPSNSREVITSQLIPGPPQNLRISSKRRDMSIKLRWDEPDKHPQAANRYKVQKRQSKKPGEWENIETVEKKSSKVTLLKTDTKYEFRVQSLNCNDEAGEWSNPVEAETRFGLFGRVLGTAGALVGGTVGGPIVGAVGGGLLAGSSAGKIPDSEAGKRAAKVGAGVGGAIAGGLAGIIGAPLIGVTTAIMANKKMSGETDDMSPQTSDDENETSMWTTMVKNSNKMSEDFLSDEDKKK